MNSYNKKISRRDFVNGVLAGSVSIMGTGLCGGCVKISSHIKTADSGVAKNKIVRHDISDNYKNCHGMMSNDSTFSSDKISDTCDVVIIGGGIGGLTAAWMLKKEGFNIKILEKDSIIGGQCKMDDSTKIKAAMASAFTDYPYNDDLIMFYKALGVVTGIDNDGYPVVDKKYTVKPPYDIHFIDGKWYSNPFKSAANMEALPFSDSIKSDLLAFQNDMMKWYDYIGRDKLSAFDFPLEQACSKDAEVRNLDKITFLEYVKSHGWDPLVSSFFEPLILSELGASHDKVSAFAAICNISGDVYPPQDNDDESGVISMPGGNTHIVLKLAKLIEDQNIINNAFVQKIVKNDDGVDLFYLHNNKTVSLHAKYAVYGAPMFMAPYLIDNLSTSKKEAISTLEYAPYIVANVHVSQTPEELAWISQIHGDGIISDIIVADWAGLKDPQKASNLRPNILTVYAPLNKDNDRENLLNKPLSYFETIILTELENILPGINRIVTGFDLYRWGHPMLKSLKGSIFSDFRISLKKPEGSIFFAGHECEGIPIIDSAILSGIRAAREIFSVSNINR